jgi:hypothetical protein
MIIKILILFFLFIILYNVPFREGLEQKKYEPYDPNNVMILAQQNAGNIIVLKQQMDTLLGMNKQIQDLSGNVVDLQGQVQSLVEANKDYVTQNLGTEQPTITGV